MFAVWPQGLANGFDLVSLRVLGRICWEHLIIRGTPNKRTTLVGTFLNSYQQHKLLVPKKAYAVNRSVVWKC